MDRKKLQQKPINESEIDMLWDMK